MRARAPHRSRRLPAALLLAPLVLLANGCNINPPHYIGDEHSRKASRVQKPEWLDWALRFQGGYAYVTGVSTRHDRREDARRAAEGDARHRLAASIEARIVADFEHRNRTSGQAGGKVVDVHEIRTQVRSTARAELQDTKVVDEYHEEYKLFVGGFKDHFDWWVLVRIPEAVYRKHLADARRRFLERK